MHAIRLIWGISHVPSIHGLRPAKPQSEAFTGLRPARLQSEAFTGLRPARLQSEAFTGLRPARPQSEAFTGLRPAQLQSEAFTGLRPARPFSGRKRAENALRRAPRGAASDAPHRWPSGHPPAGTEPTGRAAGREAGG